MAMLGFSTPILRPKMPKWTNGILGNVNDAPNQGRPLSEFHDTNFENSPSDVSGRDTSPDTVINGRGTSPVNLFNLYGQIPISPGAGYAGPAPGSTTPGATGAGTQAPHIAFSDNPTLGSFDPSWFGDGGGSAQAGYGYQPNFGATPDDPAFNDDVEKAVRELLGAPSAYTPEVMDAMKAQIHSATQGKLAANLDSLGQDAASRGMYNSPVEAAIAGQARNQAASDYGAGVQNILIQKAKADFQSKLDAIDRSQKYLDDKRQFLLARDASDVEKERTKAELSLAYTRLAQEKQSLMADWNARFKMAEFEAAPREGRDYIVMRVPNGDGTYRDVKMPIQQYQAIMQSGTTPVA